MRHAVSTYIDPDAVSLVLMVAYQDETGDTRFVHRDIEPGVIEAEPPEVQRIAAGGLLLWSKGFSTLIPPHRVLALTWRAKEQ